MQTPGEGARAAYYRAALESLRFVEGRRPTRRRFGADADATWASFRGDLTTADRIDLLIRDADAEWSRAFGARTVFDLRATADDEAFGAEWEPLDPVDAEELWRQVAGQGGPSSVAEATQAIARSWGLTLQPCPVGEVGATDSFVLAGPGAVASLVAAFARGRDLDWSTQVRVVSSPPGHRQLAAAAAALLNASRATELFSATQAADLAHPGARLLVSDDAAPEDRQAAEQIARPA